MPYYCATIKLLVSDQDLDHANETIRESMSFLVDQNTILDWGYSLQTPAHATGVNGRCGPHPRLVDQDNGQKYEERIEEIRALEAQPEARLSKAAKEGLVVAKEVNERLFHLL